MSEATITLASLALFAATAAIGAATFMMVILGFFGYRFTRDELKKAAEKSAQDTARNVVEDVVRTVVREQLQVRQEAGEESPVPSKETPAEKPSVGNVVEESAN